MKRVLVVDDSPTIRQLVRQSLAPSGFEVVEACDGAEGISRLETESDIGMVILDVNMPRMGGLEMLEKVRAQSRFSNLPIVMLTSEGQLSLIEQAKRAGARGWIVKPFKPDLLVGAVRKLMGD